MAKATSECVEIVNTMNAVEWLCGRFAPDRSLVLLVSDYTPIGVAVGDGDVCVRSGRKTDECG